MQTAIDSKARRTYRKECADGHWLDEQAEALKREWHRVEIYNPLTCRALERLTKVVGQSLHLEADDATVHRFMKLGLCKLRAHGIAADRITERLTRMEILRERAAKLGVDLTGEDRRRRMEELRQRIGD